MDITVADAIKFLGALGALNDPIKLLHSDSGRPRINQYITPNELPNYISVLHKPSEVSILYLGDNLTPTTTKGTLTSMIIDRLRKQDIPSEVVYDKGVKVNSKDTPTEDETDEPEQYFTIEMRSCDSGSSVFSYQYRFCSLFNNYKGRWTLARSTAEDDGKNHARLIQRLLDKEPTTTTQASSWTL